jgi:hypothetical protein
MLRDMQTSAVLANGDTTGYGLGLSMELQRGLRVVGHSGADAGYRAYTGRFPDQGLAVAVLCNAAPSNPAELAARMAAVYLKDSVPTPPAPVAATTKPTVEELSRIAGLFVNPTTGNVTYVSVKGTDLILGRTDGPVLTPVGPRRFWLAPQRTEWTFAPNGDVTIAFRGSPPRKPVTLVRREASRPSPTALAAYAGRYVSQELGVTYAVSAADTALRFRTGVTEPFTALPAYGDSGLPILSSAFGSPGGSPYTDELEA